MATAAEPLLLEVRVIALSARRVTNSTATVSRRVHPAKPAAMARAPSVAWTATALAKNAAVGLAANVALIATVPRAKPVRMGNVCARLTAQARRAGMTAVGGAAEAVPRAKPV